MKIKSHICLITICFLTILCACNGIENGENDILRLDFQALLSNVQEGVEVADISAVERDGKAVGYIVTLEDGCSLSLMDQPEENTLAKGVKSFSEGAENYWFELEDGEVITLSKSATVPFQVNLKGDEAEITDGGSVQVSYKVNGAGDGLEVTAMAGEGWTIEINESSDSDGIIKVTAPNPITTDKVVVSFRDNTGRQVVRALRLTSKSAVKRGNIETYVFLGVDVNDVDPSTADPTEAQRKLKQLADAGIQIMTYVPNGYWSGDDWSDVALAGLDAAHKAGLKLSVYVEYFMWRDDVCTKFVNAVKDHPALWGYQVKDEPSTEYFPGIAHIREVIRKYDTVHPLYINLHGAGCAVGPEGSYKADSFEEYVQRYTAETNPDFLSFDVYPCYTDWVLDKDLYPSLETISRIAKENSIPFWAFTLSLTFKDGYGLHSRPSLATLRFQDYMYLAYGSQGLQYFTWAAVVDDNQLFADWPILPNGEINPNHPTAEYLRIVNEEVQNRAFVFDGSDVKWVAHHNDIPIDCRPVDMSQLPEQIMSYSSESDLMLSLMENDGGKSEYLNFMSRTHLRSSKLHVRFRYPVQTVERDGSLKTLNPGDYDFVIDPGDILIIKTR